MTRRRLLSRLDQARVQAAIAEAERATTGEIRVSVAGLFWGSSRRFAERAFVRLGMAATRDRNGVLLLVLPWRRQLMVLGDQGIDARVGAEFWQQVVARATEDLHAGRVTEGLCAAVTAVGQVLAQHFPPTGERPDRNELPDHVDRG